MNYLCLVFALVGSPIFAAEFSLRLPLGRTTYQCNEWIPVTVLGLRGNNTPGEELVLRLRGEDSSSLTFNFPLRSASPGAAARSVEHLRVNGWLLRPGNYSVEVASGTVTARTNITVHSHIRRSDFKLINWTSAKKDAQILQGEDNFGYNVLLGHNSEEVPANLILAGVDFMACCAMGGGHQMDLRQALAGASSLANAIRPHLERAGIRPPLTSSEPGIVVTRHAAGDVEYLFAVNATHDLSGDPMLGMKSVTAILGLPDDGRPLFPQSAPGDPRCRDERVQHCRRRAPEGDPAALEHQL